MKKKQLIFLILTIAVTLFIFYNSLKPASDSLKLSDPFSTFVYNIISSFYENITLSQATTLVRKCAHITEFLLHSLFLGLYFYFGKSGFRKNVSWVLFFGLLCASFDEFLQNFVPGRGSLVSDVFIDFIGVAIAVLMLYIVSLKRKEE